MNLTGLIVDDEPEARCDHGYAPPGRCPRAHPQTSSPLSASCGSHAAPHEWPAVVASPGTARLLLRAPDRRTLDSIRPDHHAALAAACGRHDLVGYFVHATEEHTPRHHTGAARMFVPAIGVDEDVADANSTAELAVTLAHTTRDPIHLVLDQGDHLGAPSTVTADTTLHAPSTHVVTASRATLGPRIPARRTRR